MALELFVPGRLCLFGEHTDWAGKYRSMNADIVPGASIVTGKMWGLQVKEYLTYVWREVMSGNTDYESMTPEMVIAKRNS